MCGRPEAYDARSMARCAPSDRLPGKIKVLYETPAVPGAWERAVAHGTGLAIKRQAEAFVDYRPSKKTWVVWSWAHHASPNVISLAEVTDPVGRYGLTSVGPSPARTQAAHGDRRRRRHGDLSVTDAIGRQREAPRVWPDGSYRCPFCDYPVPPGAKHCPNPACSASEYATPERVREGIARTDQRKREEASKESLKSFNRKYAADALREKLTRQAELTAEAVRRGACTACLAKSYAFQSGQGTPKYVRHRGPCPLAR
jgi:hypothetical protein